MRGVSRVLSIPSRTKQEAAVAEEGNPSAAAAVNPLSPLQNQTQDYRGTDAECGQWAAGEREGGAALIVWRPLPLSFLDPTPSSSLPPPADSDARAREQQSDDTNRWTRTFPITKHNQTPPQRNVTPPLSALPRAPLSQTKPKVAHSPPPSAGRAPFRGSGAPGGALNVTIPLAVPAITAGANFCVCVCLMCRSLVFCGGG